MLFFKSKQSSSKKPKNTALQQQKINAIRFEYSAVGLLVPFLFWFICGLVTTVLLFVYNNPEYNQLFEYTYCLSKDDPSTTCYDILRLKKSPTCECFLRFNIPKNIKKQIYISYAVDGFYQNHRGFFDSNDPLQLHGVLKNKPSIHCGSYSYINDTPILPCGAASFSIYNDSIEIYEYDDDPKKYKPVLLEYIPLLKYETFKYTNPKNITNNAELAEEYSKFAKQISWKNNLYDLDINFQYNGLSNPDFINWMLVAPFNFFAKPYRQISKQNEPFQKELLVFDINYRFSVSSINGKKYILLSTYGIMGPRNPVMVYACLSATIIYAFFFVYSLTEKFRISRKFFNCSN